MGGLATALPGTVSVSRRLKMFTSDEDIPMKVILLAANALLAATPSW